MFRYSGSFNATIPAFLPYGSQPYEPRSDALQSERTYPANDNDKRESASGPVASFNVYHRNAFPFSVFEDGLQIGKGIKKNVCLNFICADFLEACVLLL